MTKTIHFEDIGPVIILRNRRSVRIKITVKAGGEIRVTIPWKASFQDGEKYLKENRPWVESTMAKIAKRTGSSGIISPGFLLATRNFRYEVVPAPVDRIRIVYAKESSSIQLNYPQTEEIKTPEIQKKLKTAVEGVLRFEAKRFLPLRTVEIAEKLGYRINRVTIKNNKTNWGSCSNLKNINLNLHLMRLPDRVIDYIITHELVHTVIPNHGARFKAVMERYFPDINEMESEIKKVKIGHF